MATRAPHPSVEQHPARFSDRVGISSPMIFLVVSLICAATPPHLRPAANIAAPLVGTPKANTPCGEMPRHRDNSRSRRPRRLRVDRRQAGTVRNCRSSHRRPRRLGAGVWEREGGGRGSDDRWRRIIDPRPKRRSKPPNPRGLTVWTCAGRHLSGSRRCFPNVVTGLKVASDPFQSNRAMIRLKPGIKHS